MTPAARNICSCAVFRSILFNIIDADGHCKSCSMERTELLVLLRSKRLSMVTNACLYALMCFASLFCGCRVSVICNSLICPQDLWSTSTGKPPSDMSQDYNLIAANETDGITVMEFSRDAVTEDNDKDVQFMVRSF